MITSEEVREHLGMWSRQARQLMRQYITQQETLQTKLKQYFEIKSDITSKELLNEYRALDKEIREMIK